MTLKEQFLILYKIFSLLTKNTIKYIFDLNEFMEEGSSWRRMGKDEVRVLAKGVGRRPNR